MKRILVVDDDISIGNMLEEVLKGQGYQVARAYSGTEALLALKLERPDLVLLDLMLPGLDGEEVLQEVRELPVIVVSAKAGVEDKVGLLLGGAADYVTKPFEIKELLARIAVQLRRTHSFPAKKLEFGDLMMDITARRIWVAGHEVRLTRTEYAILKLLMQDPDRVITKSFLLDQISEETPDCMESSLKVHISNLRRKLREVSGKDYIEAVWGIGFKMREEAILTIS